MCVGGLVGGLENGFSLGGREKPRPLTGTPVREEVYVVLNCGVVICYHSNRKLVLLNLVREKPGPAGLRLLGTSAASRAKN